MIYENDTEYIAEEGNVRIRVEKSQCPQDYVAFLRAELDRVLADLAQVEKQEAADVMRPTEWTKWQKIREKRNKLLAECDWTQVPDAPLDDKRREAWRQYRQALRDIPQRFERADDVAWPECPK